MKIQSRLGRVQGKEETKRGKGRRGTRWRKRKRGRRGTTEGGREGGREMLVS